MQLNQVRQRQHLSLLALMTLACLLIGLPWLPMARAEPVQVGFRDFSYGDKADAPTWHMTQSKLWWNDGLWWGSLYNPGADAHRIHRLDLPTQSWIDTGTTVETRASDHVDALWDGQRLYVVSTAGQLSRFSYDSTAKRYNPDAGFPVKVGAGGTDTITVAQDSTGQLWVSYPRGRQVWVNRTIGSDTQWGQPFVPAVSGVDTDVLDTSAILAFQGDKIGLMWSNQAERKMYFAVHRDADPDTVWQPRETVLPGPGQDPAEPWADDHINVKQVSSDGSGRVFAATKSSLSQPTAPLMMLHVRDRAGNWTSHTFGLGQEDHTRPVVLIDEEHSQLYMFAHASGTGATYYKTTPLDDIGFPPGLGTPFIQGDAAGRINNVTSTKQNLTGATGLVLLASDNVSRFYFHNYLSLNGSAPPLPAVATPAGTPTPTRTPITKSSPTSAATATPTTVPASTSMAVPTATRTPTPPSVPTATQTPTEEVPSPHAAAPTSTPRPTNGGPSPQHGGGPGPGPNSGRGSRSLLAPPSVDTRVLSGSPGLSLLVGLGRRVDWP